MPSQKCLSSRCVLVVSLIFMALIVTEMSFSVLRGNLLNNISDKGFPKISERWICSGDLFSKDENIHGWYYADKKKEWQLKVSNQVVEACNLTLPYLVPLQSSPEEIQAALDKKWILMIGDSSIRMLHDYLVGRWLGNYTHWPKGVDNHGPKEHSSMCRHDNRDCHYDVYHQGARITFIWLDNQLTDELQKLMGLTVGKPDMVVAEYLYWARKNKQLASKQNATTIPESIAKILDRPEMEQVYQQAYRNSTTYKVWFSSFQSYSKKNWLGEINSIAIKSARKWGWDIFHRSKLVNHIGKHAQNPHPMDEILEIELELLLLMLRNLPSKR